MENMLTNCGYCHENIFKAKTGMMNCNCRSSLDINYFYKRKIVQISSSRTDDCKVVVHALCNDGTLFEKWPHTNWIEYPPIPQNESEE